MLKWVIFFVVACGLPAGCKIGKENVLFTTRTNFALDLDTAPMTVDIGYKRDELVLAPIDGEGRVLPVLTSVGVRGGATSFGANHSFATGEAALVLAKYLGTTTDLDDIHDSIVEGEVRAMPDNLIRDNNDRYVFGTNTTLGLGVGWDPSGVPTSIAVGYKRKELALVPIQDRTVTVKNDNSGQMEQKAGKALASLIATAYGGTRVGTSDQTGIVVGQTFATGHAATLLATHPSIRAVIAPAILPETADAAKQAAIAAELARGKAFDKGSDDIAESYTKIAAVFNSSDGAGKAEIVEKARDLGLVKDGTDSDNFLKRLKAKKLDAANSDNIKAFEKLVNKINAD